MAKKKKISVPGPAAARICVRLSFDNLIELALVREAAARRGLGFNAFMRQASLNTARKVMEAPAEDLLGQFSE